MRTIEISTDVFSAIWKNRLAGEDSEDAVLRRLLQVVATTKTVSTGINRSAKILWRDDVRMALTQLGGEAHLDEIYRQIRQVRLSAGRRLPRSTEAIVRRELEYNSSDSESFTGKYDWFRSVDGIGAGRWALRGS